MGTNFYWMKSLKGAEYDPEVHDHMSPVWHIGKRTAAGLYCWDDQVSLSVPDRYARWGSRLLESCPVCGKPVALGSDPLSRGPAAIELGFAEPEASRPTGIAGASGFIWAQPANSVRQRIAKEGPDELLIVDEYKREMTGREFLQMLDANVPTRLNTESLNEWFC